KDEIRPRCDRFFRVNTHTLNITAPEAIVDLDISSDSPSEYLQPLVQCLRTGLRFSVVRCPHQHENLPHPVRLLRARCERPRRRHAEERNELAALHSITSSAATSSLSGTVTPSIRAVEALMTSSNLLACTTGRSAGLPPLRMRPV